MGADAEPPFYCVSVLPGGPRNRLEIKDPAFATVNSSDLLGTWPTLLYAQKRMHSEGNKIDRMCQTRIQWKFVHIAIFEKGTGQLLRLICGPIKRFA